MRKPFKPVTAVLSVACAASFTLAAACSTEPEEAAEPPVDESTIVDADAAGIGVPNAEGDADPTTALPGENVLEGGIQDEPEPPSGAEATNDITSDEALPASSSTATQTTTSD